MFTHSLRSHTTISALILICLYSPYGANFFILLLKNCVVIVVILVKIFESKISKITFSIREPRSHSIDFLKMIVEFEHNNFCVKLSQSLKMWHHMFTGTGLDIMLRTWCYQEGFEISNSNTQSPRKCTIFPKKRYIPHSSN